MGMGVYIYELTGDLTPPFFEFFWIQLWQIGETLTMTALFFLFIKSAFLRLPIYVFLYAICGLLIFWTIADPIVFSMAGDHITPSLLAHFAGPKVFLTDDLWLPIKKHVVIVITGLLTIFLLLFAFYRLFKKSYNEDVSQINIKPVIMSGLIGVVLMLIPKIFGMTYLSYPPEILYARDYYGWNRYFPEKEDIERLRNTFNESIEKEWVSDEYPLLHTIKSSGLKNSKPDIFLFVIESFRAKNAKIFNPKTGDLDLPSLERIAQRGVKFPYFISNGFPSSEGFFSLLTGTWPHSRKRIAQNYRNTEFDNIATHLDNQGYKTARLDYYMKIYKIDYWIKKYYDEGISFIETGIFPSERNMIDKTIQYIDNHDSTSLEPLFFHFKTEAPHYPYDFPNDSTETYMDLGAPSENYKVSMTYIDEQLGRFYDYLQSRKRANNTILIIVGDHANYLDKSTTTALPIDDVLWTGAIISGPDELIGSQRTNETHCSQIDILPTILDLVGDTTARVSLGRNLLDDEYDPSQTFSIAVRPAGVRIDKGGFTYIVDRRHPSHFIKFPAFDGLMTQIDHSALTLSSEDYLKIVDSWSYLIEEDRVWKSSIQSLNN